MTLPYTSLRGTWALPLHQSLLQLGCLCHCFSEVFQRDDSKNDQFGLGL